MRHIALTLFLAGLPLPALAGDIERACLSAGASAANPSLCRCIQDAADLTLTKPEQKRAASFFAEPDRAQMVRQSTRAKDAAFWSRYSVFGETAEAFCSS
jgi:hypothetical protein